MTSQRTLKTLANKVKVLCDDNDDNIDAQVRKKNGVVATLLNYKKNGETFFNRIHLGFLGNNNLVVGTLNV